MPKISFAAQIADWKQLVANARPYVDEYPLLGPLLDDLEERTRRMETVYQRRQVLRAECQLATQEIGQLRDGGIDPAIQARDLLRSKFGIHSEWLTAFNLRPRRKYKKRKKAAAPGETPGAGDAPPEA